MKRLTGFVSYKFKEKASVFLTELHLAENSASRASILSAVRKRDHDATHHCTAWREGVPVHSFGSDDDGEPSGTAGAPMLKVLEGCEITDVLAICVRWYGGTKLGTGGLVRAYTQGVQGAVSEGQRLGYFKGVRAMAEGIIEVPAELSHLPFVVLDCFNDVQIYDQEFSQNVSKLRFKIPLEEHRELECVWRERSRGGNIKWLNINK
ncbi:MAG: YigZ family protein [Holophagaceae bacterium]|nr:YigZ family protein [Holophagaceae bacterium]